MLMNSANSENMGEGENLNSLCKWMGQNGFKPSKKLKPKYFSDTGRGLMAKENISSGDIIIAIPEKLLITPKKILKLNLGNYFTRFCPKATGQEILSVFLMCEKAKSVTSKWYHYIKSLPHSYSIPEFYDSYYLSDLPASISSLMMKKVETVRQSYDQLSELLTNLELSSPIFHSAFEFEIYKWAWCSVNTRCVYIDCFQDDCSGKSCTFHLALAPFLDLLNHSPKVQVEAGFNKKQKQYEIRSLCNFEKYSQIFINYGPHDNRKLFLEYGFIVPNNLNDSIPFSIEDITSAYKKCHFSSTLLPIKLKVILQKDLIKNAVYTCDGLSWNLNLILKILCSDHHIDWWNTMISDELNMLPDVQLKLELLQRKLMSLKLNEYNISINEENSSRKKCAIKNIIHELFYIEKSLLLKAMT